MGKGMAGFINMFTEYSDERVDPKNLLFYAVEDITTLDGARSITPYYFNPYLNYHFRLIEGNNVDIILTNRSEVLDSIELFSLLRWFATKTSCDNSPRIVFAQENGPALAWQSEVIRRVYR